MADWSEHSEEELVRAGRDGLRDLRFDRAREAFAEYVRRMNLEGRSVPAGILANYALALGHSNNIREGIGVCQAALKTDRRAPEVYYCLARLYLLARSRKQAWETLRSGLSYGPSHSGLLKLQEQIGVRGRPPLPFLHRDNPLNVRLGKVFRRRRRVALRAGAFA